MESIETCDRCKKLEGNLQGCHRRVVEEDLSEGVADSTFDDELSWVVRETHRMRDLLAPFAVSFVSGCGSTEHDTPGEDRGLSAIVRCDFPPRDVDEHGRPV